MGYQDILVDTRDRVVRIMINRPDRLNAFRSRTVEELIAAFESASWNDDAGVIVLSGSGDRAFCSGGDLAVKHGEAEERQRGPNGMPTDLMHFAIRNCRKPVIARVQGLAIGGGNVLATLCDLTIASEKAEFGQIGPKSGSVDPGFGTAYLARVVGQKRAREMWFLCRRYTAHQAFDMGLCNVVVPHEELDATVEKWCREILALSPTALAIAKRSFNADCDSIIGIGALGWEAAMLNARTPETTARRDAFINRKSSQGGSQAPATRS